MGSSNFVVIIGISEAIKENKIFKTPTLFSVFYLSPLWRQLRFPILKESILPNGGNWPSGSREKKCEKFADRRHQEIRKDHLNVWFKWAKKT